MRNAFCWRRVSCLAGLSDGWVRREMVKRDRERATNGTAAQKYSLNWVKSFSLLASSRQSDEILDILLQVLGEIILTSHTRYLTEKSVPNAIRRRKVFLLLPTSSVLWHFYFYASHNISCERQSGRAERDALQSWLVWRS